MFPNIDKNMKQSRDPGSTPASGFDKIVAENTSKMVEILQAVVKSNDNLNSKTDKLIAVSEHMMVISQNMAKVSEQMMNLNEENIKWLKRLDKRMYHMNQSLAGTIQPPEMIGSQSPEKERTYSSNKNRYD